MPGDAKDQSLPARAVVGMRRCAKEELLPTLPVSSFVLLWLLLAVTGCSTPIPRGVLGPGANVPAAESVVFGQIRTETKTPAGSFWVGISTYVSVMDVQRSIPALQTPPIKDHGGLFCWHLPPGRYAVFEVGTTRTPGTEIQRGSRRCYAEFEVARPGQLIYVGCLKLPIEADRVAFVSDEWERTLTELKTAYPQVAGEPTKNLFKVEKPR